MYLSEKFSSMRRLIGVLTVVAVLAMTVFASAAFAKTKTITVIDVESGDVYRCGLVINDKNGQIEQMECELIYDAQAPAEPITE